MTRIAKILTILVVIGSLGFLGFAFALERGGPNWHEYITKPGDADPTAGKLPDYVFTQGEGTDPTWTVKSRADESFSSASANLADVILAAQNHKLQRQRDEIRALEEQVAPLEARLAAIKAAQDMDQAAIQTSEKQLAADLDALNTQINEVSSQGIQRAQEAHKIRVETEYRREDIFRLHEDLEIIRTDTFVAENLQDVLRDRIHQLDGKVGRLERRYEQLKSRMSDKKYNQ